MNIIDVLLPLYLLISLGYFFRQRGFPAVDFWPGMEKLVYFILIPALIFSTLARANIDSSLIGKTILGVALPTYLIGATQWLGFLWPGLRRTTFTSMYQGAIRNNTTIALVIAGLIMPGQGVALMALIATFMVILNNISSVMVLGYYGDKSNLDSGYQDRSFLVNLLTNPLIAACLVGLGFNLLSINLPDPLHKALYFLGQTGLPMALLTVGAGLKLTSLTSKVIPLSLPTIAKLIATPALIYGFIQFLNLSPQTAQMFVLYGAIPTAMSSYVLASQLGGDKETMAQIITLQTLVAAFTIPLVLFAIKHIA